MHYTINPRATIQTYQKGEKKSGILRMWIIKSVKNKMGNVLNKGEHKEREKKKQKYKKKVSWLFLSHLSHGYFLMPVLSERQVT